MLAETFNIHHGYPEMMASPEELAKGFGIHCSLDMAMHVVADDLQKALGLDSLPGSCERSDKFRSDRMDEKLELPQPKKVLLETLSPVPSEGRLFDSPSASLPQGLSIDTTLIIFDWDDTLLCTSWLSRHMNQNSAGDLDQHLRKIAQRLKSMLEMALRMGHTYIITNSATGWVEYSAAVWVPELLPILRQVQIVSARDNYQHLFPNDASQWKFQAFLEVRRHLISLPIDNLVVLGDADFEMEAAQAMRSEFPSAHIKTVKFQPQPTAKQHLRQVEVVAEKFERIVRKPRSMKVYLEKKGAAAQQ